MKYKRILLKLSGEAFIGDKDYGIDPERLQKYCEEIKEIPWNNKEQDHTRNQQAL